MHQNTDALWEVRKEHPISDKQLEQVRELMMSRQKASLWKNFSRLWQGTPTKGAEKTKLELGLDDRPIVLLATNVLGDSLTLGRQVFTKSMAEWIERTVQYFLARDDAQLIIRVHPGEILTRGVSMVDIINHLSPTLPDHIHLIKPTEKINTYDLVGIADIGLVYTTTVGMEMAMTGIPSIVVGDTHYRGRGFTYDPDSYVNYYKLLGAMLLEPEQYRQPREKIELAWKYAYHFFFDFPRPFPWHLVNMWDDYKDCDLKTALSEEGLLMYGDSFRYLLGEPLDWATVKYDD
jgi:capsule polysaccharide export protein KpsC/LpsZ